MKEVATKNVYILLTQTGTLLSRTIRKITQDEYTHTAISFSENLFPLYSFGRKRPFNMLLNGFICETLAKGVYARFPRTPCCVLKLPVTDSQFSSIQEYVEQFCTNPKQYKFNIIGLGTIAFGIGYARKDRYFCSQFVSEALESSGLWHKTPVLTKPCDLLGLPGAKIIYSGTLEQAARHFSLVSQPEKLLAASQPQ